MLLWNLGLLFDEPLVFITLVAVVSIALLVAITVHEFGHALVASLLGDPTAKRLGRLSLNPLRHLDPMGTLMIFLVGFGWGKPVPVNYQLLGGNPRRRMALIASAGALLNLVTAALFGGLIRVGLLSWQSPGAFFGWELSSVVAMVVGYIILLNIILAVFNLIPIPPLDGFNIAVGVLPERQANALLRVERYGPIILLIVVFLGYFTGFLWEILMWPVNGFIRLFVG
ncbi:MAG: site-2 protease family protein [Chloroflexota bacterium]|nr:site-2 protease family protein [Chloroflexota bacterium]